MTSSKYQSAQLVGWDIADLSWWATFKAEFLPSAGDIQLTPKLIARLPLLGAEGFPYQTNTDISNVVRLEVIFFEISLYFIYFASLRLTDLEGTSRFGRDGANFRVFADR